MNESSSPRWLAFLGCVPVVGVLYWAWAVIVPVALALLITFALTTPVAWLQRRVGRLPAELLIQWSRRSGLNRGPADDEEVRCRYLRVSVGS